MRRSSLLALLALALLVGAWLAPALVQDPGTLILMLRGWRVEMSLLTSVGLVGIAAILLWITWRLLHWPLGQHRSWREKRARSHLAETAFALLQRRWARSRKLMQKSAVDPFAQAAIYLLAAQSMQALAEDDPTLREELLERAQSASPRAARLVQLQRARDAMHSADPEYCLQQLESLGAKNHSGSALLLRAQALHALQHGDELAALLPQLRKQLTATEYALWPLRVTRLCMDAAASAKELQQCLRLVPKKDRHQPELMVRYCERAEALGIADQEVHVALDALKQSWSDEIVAAITQIHFANPVAVLKKMEPMTKKHAHDAGLQAGLGRLCECARLPGQALHYYQQSLAVKPNKVAYQRLAELLEEEGRMSEALSCWRAASDSTAVGKAKLLEKT